MIFKGVYERTLLKQGYNNGEPCFLESEIGKTTVDEVYAQNKEVIYELVNKWNAEPCYKFVLLNVTETDNVPSHAVVYLNKHGDLERHEYC